MIIPLAAFGFVGSKRCTQEGIEWAGSINPVKAAPPGYVKNVKDGAPGHLD
jgi:hypothetical protein